MPEITEQQAEEILQKSEKKVPQTEPQLIEQKTTEPDDKPVLHMTQPEPDKEETHHKPESIAKQQSM